MNPKLSWFLAIVTVLSVVPLKAQTATLTISDRAAILGVSDQQVAVAIAIDDPSGIAGGDLTLTYDATAITATSVMGAGQLMPPDHIVFSNVQMPAVPGEVRISFAGTVGLPASTEPSTPLFVLFFDVEQGAATGSYPLDLTNATLRDVGAQVIPTQIASGIFRVLSETCPEDFNLNGLVDRPDFGLFSEKFATNTGSDEWEQAFDLVPDDFINFLDLFAFGNAFGQVCGL